MNCRIRKHSRLGLELVFPAGDCAAAVAAAARAARGYGGKVSRGGLSGSRHGKFRASAAQRSATQNHRKAGARMHARQSSHVTHSFSFRLDCVLLWCGATVLIANRSKMKGLLLLLVAAAMQLASTVSGFVSPAQGSRIQQSPRTSRIRWLQESNSADNNDTPPQQQQQRADPVETFMEEASLKGADKVKEMSISERTKRAMLAEAVEDRIFSLYDELEELMQQQDEPTNDDEERRDDIRSLAKQIKASQTYYENLVSGEPSEMMDMMQSSESNSDE